MNQGRILAALLGSATVLLVFVGTMWPSPSAVAYAGGQRLLASLSTPEVAVSKLGNEINSQSWQKAYDGLANKAQFTEPEFVHDLTGYYPNLLTYATLDRFEVLPIHASANEAEVELKLHWSTVVGISVISRQLHVVKMGDQWATEWPLVKEALLPPQVFPVNYLRWDVIYRGPGDDWGSQDV